MGLRNRKRNNDTEGQRERSGGELVPSGTRLPVPSDADVADGRTPIMRGAYGMDPVLPELTVRQLRRLDREGPVAFGRKRGPLVERRIRKAIKRTARMQAERRERVARELKERERRARAEARRQDERPLPSPRMLLGWGTGFAGPDRLMLP